MENIEEIARQREKKLQSGVRDELETKKADVSATEEKEEPPKKSFRYYFNRFRYYHYYYSEKVRTFIMAGCMWIVKIQFYLMGLRINGPPAIHETNERHLNL